jgi:hypothetical protein
MDPTYPDPQHCYRLKQSLPPPPLLPPPRPDSVLNMYRRRRRPPWSAKGRIHSWPSTPRAGWTSSRVVSSSQFWPSHQPSLLLLVRAVFHVVVKVNLFFIHFFSAILFTLVSLFSFFLLFLEKANMLLSCFSFRRVIFLGFGAFLYYLPR